MTANTIAGESVDESYIRKIIREHEHREYRNNEGAIMQFDASILRMASHFAPYLHNSLRLKVRRTYSSGEEFVRTGTVGITSGWRPCFLLMHRSNAMGSWDTLSVDDEIIETWDGRRYEPVKKASEFV
jgi:hypothetical protein